MATKLNISDFLDQDEKKDLLRLLTAGSVDDGKSTLIGRLLFDSKKLYEDQLDALERDSKRIGNAGDNIDYALLLDGLKAEREQGITIDVAYRYFSTNKRKFIIADTPGHEQYTRNMITGGSTANLAIILVDARTGVITQTRRHTYLVSLLGIKHVVLAVNKMDLVEYDQQVFDKIVDEYKQFVTPLGIPDINCIPLSALKGDNVVDKSDNMPWYKGTALLDFLETVHIANDHNLKDFRYPIQYVLRPNLDFRGFSGKISSGIVRKGDKVMAIPSGKISHVKGIHVYEGELNEAFSPQSITITLEDEIDLSRGEMLVHPDNLPRISRNFEAMLVWMDEKPMDRDLQYYIKHTTNTTRVRIDQIRYKVDVNTMEQSMTENLQLNEIGRAVFMTNKPLFFDPYKQNKSCGAFILIDPITNNTCAVGMIIDQVDESDLASTITKEDCERMRQGKSLVSTEERIKTLGQQGKLFVISGKELSSVREFSGILERRLFDTGHIAVVFDSKTLGVSGKDMLSLGFALQEQGIIVICIDSRNEITDVPEKTVTIRLSDEKTNDTISSESDQCNYIKHTTNTTRVRIDQIRYKVDVNTMEQSMTENLQLNEIGRAVFMTNKPLFFDPYKQNKSCGAFILIDPITNNTCAVGMIIDQVDESDLASTITKEDCERMRQGKSLVSTEERIKTLGQQGKLFVISGKELSSVREFSGILERRLFDTGHIAVVFDSKTLGVSGKDMLSLGFALQEQGIIVICIDSRNEITDVPEKTVTIRLSDEKTNDTISSESDQCTVFCQNISSAVEDIINIKLS